MKCRIFHSDRSSLREAIGDIARQVEAQKQMESYDFVLIGLSCRYPVWEVNETILQRLGTDRYVAFHATDVFDDEEVIHHGVTALFIRFERHGWIECFVQEGITSRKKEALDATARYLKERKEAAHLMIAGLCNAQFAFFIEKLNGYDLPLENLQGGISSGNRMGEEIYTYQFHGGEVIKDGFVVITFHNVEMATSIALGFEPVGVQYTVTEAKGYRIYQVDNHQCFAYTIEKLIRDIDDFVPEYLWYTPLVVLDESDENLLTLRTFKEKGKEWVEFYGPVKEGQKIRLSYGEGDQLLAADIRSASALAQQLPNPEILFNFSCIARQYVLEDVQREENRIYRNFLHAPVFGFFTFGEIGHDPHKRSIQFYNETSLLTGMCER